MLCFALNCNHRNERETCSFYRFPKDPRIRKLWHEATRRDDLIVTDSSRLCSCHFVGAQKSMPSIFFWNKDKAKNVPVHTRTRRFVKREPTIKTSRRKSYKNELGRSSIALKLSILQNAIAKVPKDFSSNLKKEPLNTDQPEPKISEVEHMEVPPISLDQVQLSDDTALESQSSTNNIIFWTQNSSTEDCQCSENEDENANAKSLNTEEDIVDKPDFSEDKMIYKKELNIVDQPDFLEDQMTREDKSNIVDQPDLLENQMTREEESKNIVDQADFLEDQMTHEEESNTVDQPDFSVDQMTPEEESNIVDQPDFSEDQMTREEESDIVDQPDIPEHQMTCEEESDIVDQPDIPEHQMTCEEELEMVKTQMKNLRKRYIKLHTEHENLKKKVCYLFDKLPIFESLTANSKIRWSDEAVKKLCYQYCKLVTA